MAERERWLDIADDGEAEEEEAPRPLVRRSAAERPRQRQVRPRPARGRATRPPGAPRRSRRRARLIALVALVVAAALIWFLTALFQPFHGSGHGSVIVKIPAHSTSSQVGDLLQRDGVVSSSFFFELRATLAGERSSLRSGTYHLKLDMSYGAALKVLTTPPPPVPVTELTISEGRTRRQIAALLRSQGVRGNYVAATRRSRLLDPRDYGAPAGIPSLEGFLFPSTYELRQPVRLSSLVADQLSTFKAQFAQVRLGAARRAHLTPYDVLIVASMIEKEAGVQRDYPTVASVIYNRLKDHMPLGMDSTTRYQFDDWAQPLTSSQLAAPSPYNTRLHTGLPPTPIGNPGMVAIQAAAHPAQTNYLYFVAGVCGNGASAFTTSYSQFLVLQAKYQAARAKRGRSPVNC